MRKEKTNLPIKFRKIKGNIIDEKANKLFALYDSLHWNLLNLLKINDNIIKNKIGETTRRFLYSKEYVNINVPKVTNTRFNNSIKE